MRSLSSLPSTPPPTNPAVNTATPTPPIPIPKYPPPRRSLKSQKPPPEPSKPTSNPGLKHHQNSKYYKPVKDGVIKSDGDRSVVIGESGFSYLLPGAPFEFQFSYSETPKVKPRELAFLPRPWTGKAPLKSSKKKIPLFDSFNPPPSRTSGGSASCPSNSKLNADFTALVVQQ
ncbi:hypothetical protein K1719_004277 [Acacia pycnantha]|nr:hypothetical protein K1719_004277 [Acacia pycnantha]